MIETQHPTENAEPIYTQQTAVISARALLVGTIGVVVTCVLVTWAELVISTIRIGYLQLPPVSLAFLIVVLLTTKSITRLLKGHWLFSTAELATVYIMSIMAAMISSHGLAQKLLPLLVVVNYLGSSTNGWARLYSSPFA